MSSGKGFIKPAIGLHSKETKSVDKVDLAKIMLRNSPTDPDSPKYGRQIPIFQNGTAEDIIQWRLTLADIEKAMPLETGFSLKQMAVNLTKGRTRSTFEFKFNNALAKVNAELTRKGLDPMTEEEVSKYVVNTDINDLINYFIPNDNALWIQTRAMKRNFFKTSKQSMRDFADRILTINSYLSYFPNEFSKAQCLAEKDILDILFEAIPNHWRAKMEE